ncbi:MAG: hypothetical protein K8U57_00070 [Planctomycetes bacterium]|nr:hypothetical protein [Planctomycetota bacterium]
MHSHLTAWQTDPPPTDPGNLREVVDASMLPLIHTDHTAIDGDVHILPEDIERYGADQIVAALATHSAPMTAPRKERAA